MAPFAMAYRSRGWVQVIKAGESDATRKCNTPPPRTLHYSLLPYHSPTHSHKSHLFLSLSCALIKPQSSTLLPWCPPPLLPTLPKVKPITTQCLLTKRARTRCCLPNYPPPSSHIHPSTPCSLPAFRIVPQTPLLLTTPPSAPHHHTCLP